MTENTICSSKQDLIDRFPQDQQPIHKESVYHLSIDDVFTSLIEISDQGIRLFEHPLFSFLQSLHERFGIHVDLYLFAEGEVLGRRRTLGELNEQLRAELSDAHWIHLGPHALNYSTAPFGQPQDELIKSLDTLYEQIDCLSGKNSRSRWLRLHYFSECFEVLPYLRSKGVEAILLTDRPAVSFRLSASQTTLLETSGSVAFGGVSLLRSFQRVESLVNMDLDDLKLVEMLRERLDMHGYVALFTHEINLADPKVRDLLTRFLQNLEGLGARPVY